MQIRIVGVPPGEAPEAVRQGWVGLTLPLANGEIGPRSIRMWGVLTGPRTFLASIWHLLTRRYVWEYGYVVDAYQAMQIVAQHAPVAATWWQEHAPQYCQPGSRLVFQANACQLA